MQFDSCCIYSFAIKTLQHRETHMRRNDCLCVNMKKRESSPITIKYQNQQLHSITDDVIPIHQNAVETPYFFCLLFLLFLPQGDRFLLFNETCSLPVLTHFHFFPVGFFCWFVYLFWFVFFLLIRLIKCNCVDQLIIHGLIINCVIEISCLIHFHISK